MPPRKSGRSVSARPYSALAPLYDRIMSHVDYDRWASYILALISRHAPMPGSVLELGCGTGNLTYRLHRELACPYLATDDSEEMLEVARAKVGSGADGLRFARADFRRLEIDATFDLIVLAYDGLNYLLDTEEVVDLLNDVARLLNPRGIFTVDQSTPANSINNLAYFDDRWKSDKASYVRRSRYDSEQRLHETRFEIRSGGMRMEEVHFERAYELKEMEMMLKLSSLRVEGCYDAFTLLPASRESERIQWVLSEPHPTD